MAEPCFAPWLLWRRQTADKAGIHGGVNQNVIYHACTVLKKVIILKKTYFRTRFSNTWEHLFSPRHLWILNETLNFDVYPDYLKAVFPEALKLLVP